MTNTTVIVGAQWGDEGKGKVVDAYSEWANVIVRWGGGNNAGHTLEVAGQKLILHLIPSAVMHPGKTLVLGDQMVLNTDLLWQEITELQKIGLLQDVDQFLRISKLAHILMPYHVQLDQLRESASNEVIGTTGRGIGPAYEFKAARTPAIRMSALRHPELWMGLISKALKKANTEIASLDGQTISFKKMIHYLADARAHLLPYITNTNRIIYSACQTGKNVLFEGAQGAGLDIDHGTFPFVTSSNTLSASACLGSGIGPKMIGEIIGVSKAYTTRVGKGPFPTKIGGELEEQLRQAGREFGATTKRPRDCGWMDLPQLKYSARLNGMTGLFITKLDVLRGINPVRICIAYQIGNEKFINMDDVDTEVLDSVTPVYHDLAGFDEDISGAKKFAELPTNAQRIADAISAGAGVLLSGISVGPDREQTIWLQKP